MIVFNSFKHHLPSALQRLQKWAEKNQKKLLSKELVKLAKGSIDIYYGSLSPAQIQEEILEYMQQLQISSSKKYLRYLQTFGRIRRKGHYLLHTLSDSSTFVLRYVENPKQFVHIHPARYSNLTFRLKSNTLKTCLLAYFLSQIHRQSTISEEAVHLARKQLSLSPLPHPLPQAIQKTIHQIQLLVPGKQHEN
ncbi:MAG: hypothetical protein D6805_06600 [Planctomycetota bacterium]|nr:MAG: hypothetical protein D6805_06600 [Planctomycetota bacterium]